MALRLSDDVVFRDLAGEAVILDLATGTYFGLNAVGTRVWHLIAEHGSLEQILEALQAEYDVAEASLRQDVTALVEQLVARGLVSRDAENAPAAG